MRNSKGQFVRGGQSETKYPVGTVRVRTRHRRTGERRAFIKVAEPNSWILYAHYMWQQAHGPIPRGMCVHHKDRNKLNDSPDNLELVSKSDHIREHRSEFNDQERIRKSAETHRRIGWTTKSKTKRTGRPPTWTDEQLAQAIAAWRAGEGTKTDIERRFGLPARTIVKQLAKQK